VRSARWRVFARFFHGSGRALAASLALSVLQSLLLVPVALLVRHAFDAVIPARAVGNLAAVGGLILALYLASAGLGLVTRHTVLRATKAAITRLRAALLERIYRLPRTWFDRTDLGTLHATVVQDSERLDIMSNALVAQLLPALVIGSALGVTLAVLDPGLFLLLLVVAPVLLMLSRVLGRAVRRRTRTWQRDFDVFSTQTGLALRAVALTRAQSAEGAELARRRVELEALGRSGREMAWLQAAYTLLHGAVAAAAGVIVLVVGGRAVALGRMTLGDLLSFYTVLALLRGQASTVLVAVPQVIAGSESLARLADLLAVEEPDPYGGTRRLDFAGAIALESVTFGYGERSVLEGASLEVAPGEALALVGANGAGKSTVANLVLGLYRPVRGRVLADGVPLDELDVAALRRRIGVVLQDPLVFPTTVRENIAYGRPEATLEEVRAAARRATADEFVSALPEGYDTTVGDDGVRLSAGQRQRLAVARALLGEPALLILDEPTSSLDADAVRRLVATVRRLPGAPALLLISHDPAVTAAADRVCTLRDGRIESPPAAVAPPSRTSFEQVP
jgi:ABC-type multidrug transport system fused ATPase/permease subunit